MGCHRQSKIKALTSSASDTPAALLKSQTTGAQVARLTGISSGLCRKCDLSVGATLNGFVWEHGLEIGIGLLVARSASAMIQRWSTNANHVNKQI